MTRSTRRSILRCSSLRCSPLRRSALPFTLACAAAAALGCAEEPAPRAPAERAVASHAGTRIALSQRFDADGTLAGTVLTVEGDTRRQLAVEGPLIDARGETDGGRHLREALQALEPALLAKLHQQGVRYDVAVLLADAMLALDARAQREAARHLASGVDGDPSAAGELCELLDACSGESSPRS